MSRLFSIRSTFTVAILMLPATVLSQAPNRLPPAASLTLEDQFERKQDIAQYRGDVLVLVYGDRESTSANKTLGEMLHVHYHPTAKGQPPVQASKAPAIPVPGFQEGIRAPDVHVVPVACIGKAPSLVKSFIRGRIKKEVPDTVVLIDSESKMKDQFGMKEGESNLVLIDVFGRVRMKVAGDLNEETYSRLLQAVDHLRKEGAK